MRGTAFEATWPAPRATDRSPGVVVIHQTFGLNENIKSITRRFADEGYLALAVGLFAGRNRAVCMARLIGAISSTVRQRRHLG